MNSKKFQSTIYNTYEGLNVEDVTDINSTTSNLKRKFDIDKLGVVYLFKKKFFYISVFLYYFIINIKSLFSRMVKHSVIKRNSQKSSKKIGKKGRKTKKYNNKQIRVKIVSKRKKRKKRNKKGSKLLKVIKKTKRKTRKVKIKGGKYTEDDKRKVCTNLNEQRQNSNNYKQLNVFLKKELNIKDNPINCESDLDLTYLFSEVEENNKTDIKEVDLKEYIPNIPDNITIYASKRPEISKIDNLSTKDYQFILWLWYMKGVRLFITFDSPDSDRNYIRHKEEKNLSSKLNKFLKTINITNNDLEIQHIDINDYFTIPISISIDLPTKKHFIMLFELLMKMRRIFICIVVLEWGELVLC